jgi:hypothetical protein
MDDNEIVVKDKNGSYKLEIPVLPPIMGDDGDDMEGIEAGGGPGGNPTGATGASSTGQGEMNDGEKCSALASYILKWALILMY